jgi:hypothetical protein
MLTFNAIILGTIAGKRHSPARVDLLFLVTRMDQVPAAKPQQTVYSEEPHMASAP